MTLDVRDLSVRVPHRQLLTGVDLEVAPGECVAVVGPSGSGKTSLLDCVAGIALPDSGQVWLGGTEVTALDARARSAFRLRHVGMVFQFGELLPELSAVENAALPSRLLGVARSAAEERAAAWLAELGLGDRLTARIGELSGGEQQRVGLARALAHEPALVLADEPTGMLDEESTAAVVELLLSTARAQGVALLLSTHDAAVAAAADRVLLLRDQRLVPAAASEPVGVRP